MIHSCAAESCSPEICNETRHVARASYGPKVKSCSRAALILIWRVWSALHPLLSEHRFIWC